MSVGKKIFLLLISLLFLICFTIYNYDYNSILKNNEIDNKTRVVNTYNKYKEQLLKKYTQFKLYVLENIYEEEIEREEDNISEKTISKDTSTKIPTVINATTSNIEKTENKVKVLDKPKEKILENKITNINKVEDKKQELVKKVADEKVSITKEEIQKEINNILKENKITFQRASVKLKGKSFETVKKLVKILKKYPKIKVEIGGHTDSKGRSSLNKRISQKRANRVMKAFIDFRINPSRLSAVGYGEEFPIAKENKIGLSSKNRRVEIKIIGEIK